MSEKQDPKKYTETDNVLDGLSNEDLEMAIRYRRAIGPFGSKVEYPAGKEKQSEDGN